MHAGHLVPTEGAHGLELGVALESRQSLFKPALANQHQTEPVPGTVHLFFKGDGRPKTSFGFIQPAQFFADKSMVEMCIRLVLGQCPGTLKITQRLQHMAALHSVISHAVKGKQVIGLLLQNRLKHAPGQSTHADKQQDLGAPVLQKQL